MIKFIVFSLIILVTIRISGQNYTDVKAHKEAGVEYIHQELLNIGIGNCELELIKSGRMALYELGHTETGFTSPYKNTTEIAKLLSSKGAKVTPEIIKRTKESLVLMKGNRILINFLIL